jgi:hypothetical protein
MRFDRGGHVAIVVVDVLHQISQLALVHVSVVLQLLDVVLDVYVFSECVQHHPVQNHYAYEIDEGKQYMGAGDSEHRFYYM